MQRLVNNVGDLNKGITNNSLSPNNRNVKNNICKRVVGRIGEERVRGK